MVRQGGGWRLREHHPIAHNIGMQPFGRFLELLMSLIATTWPVEMNHNCVYAFLAQLRVS